MAVRACGDSAELGSNNNEVVGDALSVLLTQEVIDIISATMGKVVNKIKYDLVYGWDNPQYGSGEKDPIVGDFRFLPQTIDAGSGLGDLIVNWNKSGSHQGFLNFGNATVGIDLQDGDKIGATLNITSESGVNPYGGDDALFVQGEHDWWYNCHFQLKADKVNVTNVQLDLGVNEQNMIVAGLNFSNCNLSVSGARLEYGVFSVPSWLLDFIVNKIVKAAIKNMPIQNIPIMDAGSIGIQVENMDVKVWPMDLNPVFTSSNSELKIDLGVGMDYTGDMPEGADKLFISTIGDIMPEITRLGPENIAMAINDDLINMAAKTLVLSGMLNGIDLSEKIIEELPEAMRSYNQDLTATIAMPAPPVADFSQDGLIIDSETQAEFGVYNMADLRIDLKNFKLLSIGEGFDISLSIDAEAAIAFSISEDMKELQARANAGLTQVDIKVLYCSDMSTNILNQVTSLARAFAVMIINLTLDVTMDQEIPTIELYDLAPVVTLEQSSFENNFLITRLILDIQDAPVVIEE